MAEPEMSAAQKARAYRHHGPVNRELRLVRLEARAEAFGEAIDLLRANGHPAAADLLEQTAFEPSPDSARSP